MKLSLISFVAFVGYTAALRICHHNDYHARYAQVNKYNSPCDEDDIAEGKCYSGIARLAKAMSFLECDVKIHAGDFVQGSVYDTVFGADIAIDAYNWGGYDIVTLGNHEFNKGPTPIVKTIWHTSISGNTTWVSSNVNFTKTPKDFPLHPAVNKDGVCYVSALTTATVDISSPGENVMIHDETASVKKALSMCDSTENVVAINHQGYEEDVAMCESIPELDLVIGGHSHTNLDNGDYPTKIERADGSVCWVVQASAYGRYLGVLDTDFDDGVAELKGHAYLPMDKKMPLDMHMAQMLHSKYTIELDASIKVVVGEATKEIDGARSSCRAMECEAGNMICDAMLAYAGPKQGATLCIQNGGGIRASIDAGPVTLEEVMAVLPFGNVHAVAEIPGSTVIAALENGFMAIGSDSNTGRFPQVGGMVVSVDYSALAGSRVVKVEVDGAPIEPTKLYKVVTNSFLAGGGDGYDWSGATSVEVSGRGLDTLTKELLTANNPYTPFTEGRIINVAAITN